MVIEAIKQHVKDFGHHESGDGSDWAIPGFFESDEEFEEFQQWLREERSRMV